MDDNVGAAKSLAFTHKPTVAGTDAAVLIRREPFPFSSVGMK